MVDCVQTWRRKLRVQELVDIAEKELDLGTEITQIYKILDKIIQVRWNSIPTTRKQYLDSVKKFLQISLLVV